MFISLNKRPKETCRRKNKKKCYSRFEICIFRERECGFSLSFRAIRPLEFFGTRRKVALRSEAYEWAPVLRSFDRLREVWVLILLEVTLYLSVL